jgi:TPR repeat protein
MLGIFYSSGDAGSVKRDLDLALDNYQKAAKLGDTSCYLNIFQIYVEKKNIRNAKKAMIRYLNSENADPVSDLNFFQRMNDTKDFNPIKWFLSSFFYDIDHLLYKGMITFSDLSGIETEIEPEKMENIIYILNEYNEYLGRLPDSEWETKAKEVEKIDFFMRILQKDVFKQKEDISFELKFPTDF